MNKSYIISISQGSIRLYGGRLEDNGSYTVLEVETLNTVEELFAVDELKENRTDIHLGLIFTPSFPSEDKEKTKKKSDNGDLPNCRIILWKPISATTSRDIHTH